MTSHRPGGALAVFLLLLLGGCEQPPNLPGSVQCSGGMPINAAAGMKIAGSISDIYDVYREFSDPNSSDTREEHKTTLQVDVDLTIGADGTSVYGTAEVTWERRDRRVYRQNPGVCADGQLIDSNTRKWTVNLTGQFFCTSDGKLGIMADGITDGSDIPTTLRYHDHGCHAGREPCYDQTSPTSELVTWDSIFESGFTGNDLETVTNMTVPAPFSGSWDRIVHLEIFTPTF